MRKGVLEQEAGEGVVARYGPEKATRRVPANPEHARGAAELGRCGQARRLPRERRRNSGYALRAG